jgi:hypothetical protein
MKWAGKRKYSALYSPPVGELDKDAVSFSIIMAELVFQEIAVQPQEKHRTRLQDPAHQKAAVPLLVVMVVI